MKKAEHIRELKEKTLAKGVKEIKEAIAKRKFSIAGKEYFPLSASQYWDNLKIILKELRKKDSIKIRRCGTVSSVLSKNGLTQEDYRSRLCRRNNDYPVITTCYEIIRKN